MQCDDETSILRTVKNLRYLADLRIAHAERVLTFDPEIPRDKFSLHDESTSGTSVSRRRGVISPEIQFKLRRSTNS